MIDDDLFEETYLSPIRPERIEEFEVVTTPLGGVAGAGMGIPSA